MSRDDNELKSQDSKEELRMANERRVETLLEINNRYVRTQRHLEEYSHITDLDRLKHVLKVQEEREGQMKNLKNIIAYGKHEEADPVSNLKKNIEYTEHYLQHHESHMDDNTLQRTKEKQQHRKEQLDILD